jgi:hypothetical protein
MSEWTDADVRSYCDRNGFAYPDGIGPAPGKAKKESKYHNRRTERDGAMFDSKREADRWGELRLMGEAGAVAGVGRQVTFFLPGRVRYIADFVILYADGRYEVEDAKGGEVTKTQAYRIKRRLMKAVHGIDISEV